MFWINLLCTICCVHKCFEFICCVQFVLQTLFALDLSIWATRARKLNGPCWRNITINYSHAPQKSSSRLPEFFIILKHFWNKFLSISHLDWLNHQRDIIQLYYYWTKSWAKYCDLSLDGNSWSASNWQITIFSSTLTSSECQLKLMNDFIFCLYKVM